MSKSDHLPYLPAMFATCMLFQVIYVLCVALWVFFPNSEAMPFWPTSSRSSNCWTFRASCMG